MNKMRLLSSFLILCLMVACGSYPTTRDGYVSAIQDGGAFVKKFSDVKDVTIDLPIGTVFSNMKSQIEKCIIPQYNFDSRISVSSVSTTTVFNDVDAVMVTQEQAEITFQQSTTSGVKKHYELVIDLVKVSENTTHYKSYANKRYSEAPFMWAKGSKSCLDFDGYIVDEHRP